MTKIAELDLTTLKAHPAADIFPMIGSEEYPSFRDNIGANGQIEKIVLLDGLILDGRNRYKVLTELDARDGGDAWRNDPGRYITFEAKLKEMGAEMSALDYVLAENLERRHLSESQRSMSAARAANMRQGERTDLQAAPFDPEPSANLRKVSAGDAASMFRVSERLVNSATNVIRHGVEQLRDLVDQGQVAVSVAEEIARMATEDQQKIVAETQPKDLKNAAKKVRRQRREAELAAKQKALPVEKFGVILADPEWLFKTRSENGLGKGAENHYTTSALGLLMARRVGDIAADDSVLYMWARIDMLLEAFCVADAWGFASIDRDPDTGHLVIDKRRARYVSQWSWLKDRISTGFWGRGKHEVLLIFTRGKPVAPAPGTQPESVLMPEAILSIDETPAPIDAVAVPAKVREHSRKPDLFIEWIEKLYPNTAKIELNAREEEGKPVARPGWKVWGNEAPREAGEETDGEKAVKRRQRAAKGGAAASAKKRAQKPQERAKGSRGTEEPAKAGKAAVGDPWPPNGAKYEGAHTDETDAVIQAGFKLGKSHQEICDALGISYEKRGIIKGRANRKGWTDRSRIAENNKARAKK